MPFPGSQNKVHMCAVAFCFYMYFSTEATKALVPKLALLAPPFCATPHVDGHEPRCYLQNVLPSQYLLWHQLVA